MPIRRAGRPGLIGLAARTAVVSGTATAVSGRVARRQVNRAREEQYQYEQQAMTAAPSPPAPVAPTPAPAAAPAGGDLVAKIGELAQLHAAGALTDAEFAAAKAQLLG